MQDSSQNLVSVVIAAFKCEKYVRESIASVLNQTYSNIEIIVVGDESVQDVLADEMDQIVFIKHKLTDPARARNIGLKAAKGDFLAFLDGDDVWLENKIKKQLSLFQNQKVGLVYSYVDVIDSNGYFLKRGSSRGFSGNVLKKLFMSNFIPTSSVVIRRSVYDKFGGFIELNQWHLGEDYEYWLRISLHYEISFVGSELVLYRKHTSNISNNLEKLYAGEKKTLEKFYKTYLSQKPGFKKIWMKRLSTLYYDFGIDLLYCDREEESKLYFQQSLELWPFNFRSLMYSIFFKLGFNRKDFRKLKFWLMSNNKKDSILEEESSNNSGDFETQLTAPYRYVSVVIPCYNSENYICNALDSVLNQTYKNFEIIVVDDGSTDSSLKVVQKYCERYPDIIRLIQQKNAGPSVARNHGVSKAKGDWIAFLDSDDVWKKSKLQTQMNILDREGGVEFITCGYTAYQNDEKISEYLPPSYSKEKLFKQMFFKNQTANTSGVLVKKSAFFDLGGFDENLFVAEDWDLWIRLIEKYRFYCLRELLVDVYIHKNSLSSFGEKNLNNELRFLNGLFSRYNNKFSVFFKGKAYSYRYRAAAISFRENNERKKSFKCILKMIKYYPLHVLNIKTWIMALTLLRK